MKKLTKEEKLKIKEEKKRIKKEKEERYYEITKFNKTSIIFSISIGLLVLFLILNVGIMYFSTGYSYSFIRYIYNFIYGCIYYFASLIPKFNVIYLAGYFIVMAVLLILMSIIENSKSDNISKLNKYYNHFIRIFIGVLVVFAFSSLYGMYIQNFGPNFDELLFEETKNKTYDVDDLVKLNTMLKDDILKYSSVVDRDLDGYINYNGDYNKDVVSSLKNVSDDIKYLKGLYPKKSGDFDDKMRNSYGSSTIGLTSNFYTYFDYSLDPISVLITMTHEYCHTKGIGRENEAVFCSYYAGINSRNPYLEYAATIEAFYRVNDALMYFNSFKAQELYEEVTPLCMDENYSEICDLGLHNTNEYIKGSTSINLYTYFLSNYKGENKERLIESLKVLSDNGAEFKVHDLKASLDDVLYELNNGSNVRVSIKIKKFNKKLYNKIKGSIDDKRLYLIVYQDNGETPVNDNSNLKKYYLEPFKDGKYDQLKLNYGSYYYDYDRSTRLFLEYYDKEKLF